MIPFSLVEVSCIGPRVGLGYLSVNGRRRIFPFSLQVLAGEVIVGSIKSARESFGLDMMRDLSKRRVLHW